MTNLLCRLPPTDGSLRKHFRFFPCQRILNITDSITQIFVGVKSFLKILDFPPSILYTCKYMGGFTMNENEIKNQICDICGKMWQLGWVAANDGNVSVKLGGDCFLATPTGISKSFITPDKLVKINAKGEVIEGADGFRPSSEIKMHLRCYEQRDDVGAVIHAHPPVATGYAVANKALDGYTMIEAVIAIGSVPVTPYGTPSTYEVPDAITPYLQEHDVMLLQNHGALTVGSDLLTAYYRMETLELWAKISLNAHLLGGAQEISRGNIDRLCGMRTQYGVTGKHPGYKKYPNGGS
jgi:L-fuculose-phosphate aldolase